MFSFFIVFIMKLLNYFFTNLLEKFTFFLIHIIFYLQENNF